MTIDNDAQGEIRSGIKAPVLAPVDSVQGASVRHNADATVKKIAVRLGIGLDDPDPGRSAPAASITLPPSPTILRPLVGAKAILQEPQITSVVEANPTAAPLEQPPQQEPIESESESPANQGQVTSGLLLGRSLGP